MGGLHLNEDGAHILKQNFINIINTWYGKAYAGAFRAPLTANNTTAVEKPVDTISEQGETEDAFTFIKKYRSKNNGKVILANLNLNSIPNKFSSLKEIISNNIDVLVIQETKIDETFPKGSFDIPGYKRAYHKDRNIHGGGILVHVR